MLKISRLHDNIASAGVPIVGVCETTPGVYRVDFAPGATEPQISQANSIVAAFDPSDAAQTAWEESRAPERTTLRKAAANAVTDIDAFLALATPTNAQVLAQVKKLSQYSRAIISRLIQID